VGRLLEDDDQRARRASRYQQLVIVDAGDDLSLSPDHGFKCGATGGGQRIPEACDRRALERSVYHHDVLHDVGVIYLSVLNSKAFATEMPTLEPTLRDRL
jgi:hypothetical protein